MKKILSLVLVLVCFVSIASAEEIVSKIDYVLELQDVIRK